MTIKASKVRFNIDAENFLRDEAQGAITASANTASKALGALSADWNAGELAMPQQVAVVLLVDTLDKTTGDETYKFEVEVGTDATFGTKAVVATLDVGSVGVKEILVAKDTVLDKLPNAAFIRVAATLAGTTPSVKFAALLSPIVGR